MRSRTPGRNRAEKHAGGRSRLGWRTLSLYPETLNLKLLIVLQPVGTRPLFILEEEHPLATAQRDGISRADAMELCATLLHIQGA
jgi:hypothetical protein